VTRPLAFAASRASSSATSKIERDWTALMLGTMSPLGESMAIEMLWAPW
jgi:hypothetical protein